MDALPPWLEWYLEIEVLCIFFVNHGDVVKIPGVNYHSPLVSTVPYEIWYDESTAKLGKIYTQCLYISLCTRIVTVPSTKSFDLLQIVVNIIRKRRRL